MKEWRSHWCWFPVGGWWLLDAAEGLVLVLSQACLWHPLERVGIIAGQREGCLRSLGHSVLWFLLITAGSV